MKKFLLADDHHIVRTGLGLIIRDEFSNAEIDECSNGDCVWKKIRSAEYDLVILSGRVAEGQVLGAYGRRSPVRQPGRAPAGDRSRAWLLEIRRLLRSYHGVEALASHLEQARILDIGEQSLIERVHVLRRVAGAAKVGYGDGRHRSPDNRTADVLRPSDRC